jgi:hypothetical protein
MRRVVVIALSGRRKFHLPVFRKPLIEDVLLEVEVHSLAKL